MISIRHKKIWNVQSKLASQYPYSQDYIMLLINVNTLTKIISTQNFVLGKKMSFLVNDGTAFQRKDLKIEIADGSYLITSDPSLHLILSDRVMEPDSRWRSCIIRTGVALGMGRKTISTFQDRLTHTMGTPELNILKSKDLRFEKPPPLCRLQSYQLVLTSIRWLVQYSIKIDSMVQDCSISSASALEILQFCTKQSKCLSTMKILILKAQDLVWRFSNNCWYLTSVSAALL